MTAQKDDLEAVRAVTAALEGFDASDQERIIRWAREKLGLTVLPAVQPRNSASEQLPPAPAGSTPASPAPPSSGKDLKTFYAERNPRVMCNLRRRWRTSIA